MSAKAVFSRARDVPIFERYTVYSVSLHTDHIERLTATVEVEPPE
jgi:hypothetical protein